MKRFTESTKWDDPWFWELSPPAKLLWFFLCDHCDSAGVIDLSLRFASMKIGLPVDEKHLAELNSRLHTLETGKQLLTGFIRFQYGRLSRDCKPHTQVFASLEHHKIDLALLERDSKGYSYPTGQDKTGKGQVQEKEEEKERGMQGGKPTVDPAPLNPPVDSNWPQRIVAINGWFCEQMTHRPHMDSGLEMLWMQWFSAGFEEDDFKRVFKFKRDNIAEHGDHPGCLRLTNILEPQRFREDLILAKQDFKGRKKKQREQPLWAQIEASEKLLADVSKQLKRTELPNVLAYEKGEKNPRYKTDFEKAVTARVALVEEKKQLNERLAELRRRQAGGEA